MSGGTPDPAAARAWLKEQIENNKAAFVEFLTSKEDVREDLIESSFPYQSGPWPKQFGGIVSVLLLIWAKETPAGFSFLRKVMARLVRSGNPVPEAWRDLAAGILDGTTTAPGAKKGRRKVNDRRDELVLVLVKLLQVQFALPRLSNPLNQNGESAIEIVIDALTEIPDLKFNIKPESIEAALARKENANLIDPIIRFIDRST